MEMRKIHERVCVSVIAILCVVIGASGNENLLKVKVSEVVRAKFGSGPDNIGICTPGEANPEGPMSFALGQKKEIKYISWTK